MGAGGRAPEIRKVLIHMMMFVDIPGVPGVIRTSGILSWKFSFLESQDFFFALSIYSHRRLDFRMLWCTIIVGTVLFVYCSGYKSLNAGIGQELILILYQRN